MQEIKKISDIGVGNKNKLFGAGIDFEKMYGVGIDLEKIFSLE